MLKKIKNYFKENKEVFMKNASYFACAMDVTYNPKM